MLRDHLAQQRERGVALVVLEQVAREADTGTWAGLRRRTARGGDALGPEFIEPACDPEQRRLAARLFHVGDRLGDRVLGAGGADLSLREARTDRARDHETEDDPPEGAPALSILHVGSPNAVL